MTRNPLLIDDNVEDIRRIRREISNEFKTLDEYIEYVHKSEKDIVDRERRELSTEKTQRSKLAAARTTSAKSKRKAI